MNKTIPYINILKVLIKINILWCILAPLFLVVITVVFSNSAVFILKDAVFYFSFCIIFFLPNRFFNIRDKIKLLLFIICFLIFLLSITFSLHNFHYWQIFNVRQLLAPIMVVSFLSFLKVPEDFNEKIIIYIFKTVVFLIIIGRYKKSGQTKV